MKKRIISIALILALVMTLIPAQAFAGAEAEGTSASLDTEDYSMTADNSFGELLLNTVENNGEEDTPEVSGNTASKVSSLKFEGKTATVQFSCETDAELVVGVYSEDGYTMLGSGRTRVYAGDIIAAVEIEIDTMPEYFRCAAFIMDADTFEPLSEEYTSREYTLEFQEFLAKTVEDFDEDRVLNLDGDNTNNFAVYGKDTVVVNEAGTDMSISQNASGAYVIKNACAELKALRAGDSLAYNCADGSVVILIVQTAAVSGDTVTLTENTGAELNDVFEYVKIDTTGAEMTYDVDNSALEEGVTPVDYVDPEDLMADEVYVEIPDEEGQYDVYTADPIMASTANYEEPLERSVGIKLSYDLTKLESKKGIELTGTVSLALNINIEIYIDYDWQYVNIELSPTLAWKGEVKLSQTAPREQLSLNIPLSVIPVEILPGIAVILTPSFVIEPEITATLSLSWVGKVTACFDSDRPEGDKFSHTKSGKVKLSGKIEGKIFAGLDFEAKLSVLADALSEVKISLKAGGEVSATLEPTLDTTFKSTVNDPDALGYDGMAHTCKPLSCLGGDVSLVIEGSAKASFLKCEKLSVKGSVTFAKLKLMDFYWHIGSGEGIVWGSTCPNKQYEVSIKAIDAAGKAVPEAEINIVTKYGEKVFSTQPTPDESGECSFYLPNGDYLLSLSYQAAYAEYSFTVCNKSKELDITLKDNSAANGSCGENAEWSLTKDGTLIIRGSGATADFSYLASSPWTGETVKKLVVNSGITRLGEYSFSGLDIKTVILPETLTEIGAHAFAGTDISEITIPTSLKKIGKGAFYKCGDLKKVYYNGFEEDWSAITIEADNEPLIKAERVGYDNVYKMGKLGKNNQLIWTLEKDGTLTVSPAASGALCAIPDFGLKENRSPWAKFSKDISSVVINKGVTGIGAYAFACCPELSSVEIPEGVTFIGEHAFDSDAKLLDISLPVGLETVFGYAFNGCSGLVSISIEEGLTAIGMNAFFGCTGLETVFCNMLEDKVEELKNNTAPGNECLLNASWTYRKIVASGSYWMLDSFGLLRIFGEMGNIKYSDSQPWKSYRSNITDVFITDDVQRIVDVAFYGCRSLTSVTIPDSVTSIGNRAFYDCRSLTSVTIPDSVTSIGGSAFSYCSSLTSVTIPDSVTRIYGCAFEGCRNLTSVTIPNSVTSIESSAFYKCSSLTSVTIPDSVTSIGGSAFSDCRSLKNVYYGGDIASWLKIYFDNNWANPMSYAKHIYINGKPVTDIVIPEGTVYIPAYAFVGWKDAVTVTIPDSVTSIGSDAFHYCRSLTSVTIPDSVTSIIEYAFSGCSSLTSVTIPDSVTSIGYQAFRDCSSLTSVTIPDSVMSIGDWAFSYCTGLKSVTIPDSVTSIGSSAFSHCSSLTSVTIPDSVTSIGGSAFSNCSSLTSVTIPDSVMSIGDRAFYDCDSLTSVTIGNSVTSIGEYAFYCCTGLTSVTIGNSVTSIDSSAFHYCSSLKDVYYSGTAEQWSAIKIGNYNTSLHNATKHYNSTGPENVSGSLVPPQGTAELPQETPAPPETAEESADITLLAAYSGTAGVSEAMRTASFTGLVPGEEYVFACMKDEILMFKSSNLLYIGQGNADENGALCFSFIPREDCESFVIRAYGLSSKSIADGEVSVYLDEENLIRTSVCYGGEELREDYDYTVALSYDGQGDRTVILRGRGEYAGEYTCTLHSWKAESYITAPSCTEGGIADCVCENCGKTERVELRALGHDITARLVLPTVTESGYTLRTCSRCDCEEKTDFVDPLCYLADPTQEMFIREEFINAVPAAAQTIIFGKRSDYLDEISGLIGQSISANKFIRVYSVGEVSYVLNESDALILFPENCSELFCGREHLTSLVLSNADTFMTKDMSRMFASCRALTELDLSNINTVNVTDMSEMFRGDQSLTVIYASDRFTVSKVKDSENMFLGCTELVGGGAAAYSEQKTDMEMASGEGYFTAVNSSEFLIGDVNRDGLFNAADILRLKKYLVGFNVIIYYSEADVNCDGEINAVDLLRAKKALINQTSS